MAKNVEAEVKKAQQDLDLQNKNYTVELQTNKGPIRLEFFPDVAPGHVKNFVALAKIGFYDGISFHRVIDGFMIQGGCPLGSGTGSGGYTIQAEFNETPHVAGVLSMARSGHPDSAGSQVFVCLGTHKHLDRNYTAFGKVQDAESMETVQKIGKVRTGSQDRPAEKIVIEKAVVTETPK